MENLLKAIIVFLKEWGDLLQIIISAIALILTVIIVFVKLRKKGLSFADIILGLLLGQLPKWISEAEEVGGTGEQKKVSVLNKALNYVTKKLGRKLTEEESTFIVSQSADKIEEILATPQKKESQKEVKQNAKYR